MDISQFSTLACTEDPEISQQPFGVITPGHVEKVCLRPEVFPAMAATNMLLGYPELFKERLTFLHPKKQRISTLPACCPYPEERSYRQRGFVFPEDMKHQMAHDMDTGKRQLFANQSRQQHLRPLVAEFGSYLPLIIDVAHSSEVTVLTSTWV